MRDKWLGIQDSESAVGGNDAFDAVGISFAVEKELRRRPGLLKLCAQGGRAIGAFRSAVAGVWIVIAKANGDLVAVNLATPTTSTTLKSSYNTTLIPSFAFINSRLYITNNFDRVQVWNGVSATTYDAGIAAPSAAPTAPTTGSGSCTVGTHLIRFRYLDNTSPASTYRSNASPILSQSVTTAANASLTFSIGTSSTNIIRSSDPKVTTIQVEMTAASGSIYYVAATANNAATSVVVNITDANLALAELGGLYDSGNGTDEDLGTGNEQPPLGSIIAQCRDYTFIGGDEPFSLTGVGVTNNSTTVTGTGFSPQWNQRRKIRIGTDTVEYLIDSVNAAGTSMTLVNAYTGSTNANTTASVYAQNPNTIYWSAFIAARGAVMPESFRAAARARNVLNGTGDRLSGMVEFNGDLLILGRFTSERLVFVDDPGAGEIDKLSGQFGTWNQRCIVSVEGQVYAWGPNGVWVGRGGGPQWISRDIEETYGAIIDTTYASKFHGTYDPATKTIRWFYVGTGDTTCKDVIAYDIPGGRWVREEYRQAIDASIFGADSNGKIQCMLSDSTNGFTFYRQGATDGVPSSSTGAYTANTGSTTTVTQVTDSLPTGTLTDLAGLMLYRPSTSETVAITSNTISAITHAAFATAATVGESIYVGAIPWTYETTWWTGDGLAEKKRVAFFIEVVPGTTTGIAKVYFYADWATTPFTFTTESTYDPPKGVLTFVTGQNYLEIDFGNVSVTDGFIKIPMPLDWRRVVRAKIEIVSPAGTPKIMDAYFAIQAKADSKPSTVNE